jgi:hypothetical protein
MSTTELYYINKDGEVDFYKEFENANKGAMLIWQIIAQKYWNKNYWDFDLNDPKNEFWRLTDLEETPKYISLVFQSTFDNVVILKKDFHKLIAAYEEFLSLERANETNISLFIQAFKDGISDPEVFGFCWNQTSVNAFSWEINEELPIKVPGYENVTGDRKYNIFKDSDHWFFNTELVSEKKEEKS